MKSADAMLRMSRYEAREHRGLLEEAKRPELVELYRDERKLNALWDSIELAQRFQWPSDYEVNV